MANYYVSADRGSDSTGDGSAADPWATIDKAIGGSPAITMAGGTAVDRLYIEPGIYREVVTLGLSPTSTNTLEIIGDGDGAGFRAGGYSTPRIGTVDWRGWSDDTTPITTTNGQTLVASGKSYTTVQGLKITGSNPGGSNNCSCLHLSGTWSDWTFRDCIFVSPAKAAALWIAGSAGNALNLLFDCCDIYVNPGAHCLYHRMPSHSAEYNANVHHVNCRFFGGQVQGALRITQVGGSGSGRATGYTIQHCDFIRATMGVAAGYESGDELTTPIVVRGCKFVHCSTGITAAHASHIDEDGNAFIGCTNARSGSVATGSDSVDAVCPTLDFEDGRLYGVQSRPIGTPLAGSAVASGWSYGTPPTVDVYNRPRPSGGATTHAAGAMAIHDTARKEETITVSGVGSAIDGPGDQLYEVSVDAVPTTLKLQLRYNTDHGTTNKPRVRLLATPELDVAAQTITMSEGVDTWELIEFDPITPTAKGAVVLIVESRAESSDGTVYIDEAP